MLDCYSGGRIISGFVRGAAAETLQAGIDPTENRERFEEAHDLIIKCWTTPGPFRYEGKYYHYRVVNPWVLPIQKPHLDIWYPGSGEPRERRVGGETRLRVHEPWGHAGRYRWVEAALH